MNCAQISDNFFNKKLFNLRKKSVTFLVIVCQILEANVLNTINCIESCVSALSCHGNLMFRGPNWYSDLFIRESFRDNTVTLH